MAHPLAIFDKSGLLSTMNATVLYSYQQLMGNMARPDRAMEGVRENPALSEKGYVARALEALKTGTKIGVMALATSLTQPAAAQETGADAQITRVAYSDNPAFQEFQHSGLTRGDRGADQPNRFDDYLALFEGFTPASQDFILRAFSAGKLTEVEEGQNLDFENGKLAANLIGMMRDTEVMARYIETRVIPEDRQIPKASDEFDRMLRDFPEVAQVLTPEVQARIIALEDQVLVTLREENEVLDQQLADLRSENATLQADTAARREHIADLRSENAALDRLNARLEALLAELQS